MTDKTLTLNDASKLTGVSTVTLRRRIKEGRLDVEPRKNNKAEIRVTSQGLIKAGFTLQDEIMSTATALLADRESEISNLREQLGETQARLVALERQNSAIEARFEQVKEDYQLTLNAVRESLALASQNSQRLIIDQPSKPRWKWLKRLNRRLWSPYTTLTLET